MPADATAYVPFRPPPTPPPIPPSATATLLFLVDVRVQKYLRYYSTKVQILTP
jgi:hypothetical protein